MIQKVQRIIRLFIGLFLFAAGIVLTINANIQFTFKVFKFDVSKITHRFIDEDIKDLKEKLAKRKFPNTNF